MPTHYRRPGCDIPMKLLGSDYTDVCGADGNDGRAAALNALFEEWNDQRRGKGAPTGKLCRYGTIDWLFREYKQTGQYLEKKSSRSRPDAERMMLLICDLQTKRGVRPGDCMVAGISPRAAEDL